MEETTSNPINTQQEVGNEVPNTLNPNISSTETPREKTGDTSKRSLILLLVALLLLGFLAIVFIYISNLNLNNNSNSDIKPTNSVAVTSPIITSTAVTTPVADLDGSLLGKIKKVTNDTLEFSEWARVYPADLEYKEYCAKNSCPDEGDFGIDIPRNKDYSLTLSSALVIKLLRHPDNNCEFEQVMSLKQISLAEFLKDECGQYTKEYTSFFEMNIVDDKVTEITEQYRP